jgi:hypothetical protein
MNLAKAEAGSLSYNLVDLGKATEHDFLIINESDRKPITKLSEMINARHYIETRLFFPSATLPFGSGTVGAPE